MVENITTYELLKIWTFSSGKHISIFYGFICLRNQSALMKAQSITNMQTLQKYKQVLSAHYIITDIKWSLCSPDETHMFRCLTKVYVLIYVLFHLSCPAACPKRRTWPRCQSGPTGPPLEMRFYPHLSGFPHLRPTEPSPPHVSSVEPIPHQRSKTFSDLNKSHSLMCFRFREENKRNDLNPGKDAVTLFTLLYTECFLFGVNLIRNKHQFLQLYIKLLEVFEFLHKLH